MDKKWELISEILDIMEAKSGQPFTCSQIHAILSSKGLDLSLQKVQRAMRDLNSAGKVKSNEMKGKSLEYRVPKKNEIRFHGNVKPNELFSFLLWSRVQAELFRDPSGFEPFQKILGQQMKLDQSIHGKDIYSELDSKISGLVFFAGQQTMVGPSPNVAPVLLEALLHSYTIEVLYESAIDAKPKWRTIEPWCLLVYRQELYFLCPTSKNPDILVRYKLARIKEAKLLKSKTFQKNYNLLHKEKEHLKTTGGMWDDRGSKPCKVRLAFAWAMRHYMHEVYFCQSQKVILHEDVNDPDENWVEVTMQVPIGEDLLDWVRRWGDGCEVLSPKALRDKMAEYGEWLVEMYGD